jgi:hypothetical protein
MTTFSRAGTMMFLGVLFSISAATAQDTPIDKQKAKIVSRVYQLTYGADAICKRFSPQESDQVSSAVIRFKNTYPELMMLVDQSSYLERAQNHFAGLMERIAKSASKNPKEAGCQELLILLNQSIDTENGKKGILDIIAQLKK